MAVYRTTLRIDASVDVVWAILVDLPRWSEWNPSVPQISGDVAVGSTLSLKLVMPNRPSPNVKATLLAVEPQKKLHWHGNVGADWLFAGDREFLLEPDGAGTSFTHIETVRGAIFPLFKLIMGSAIQKHHDGLNVGLKTYAEARARQAG